MYVLYYYSVHIILNSVNRYYRVNGVLSKTNKYPSVGCATEQISKRISTCSGEI